MKKNKPKLYTEILEVFKELKSLYPSYTIGKHLSTALDEYGDIWGLSDKEVLFALNKYKAQMEMDVPHETDDEEIDKIIKDGLSLGSPSTEEDE